VITGWRIPVRSTMWRRLKAAASRWMGDVARRTGSFSGLYYFAANKQFDREHRAVLAGRHAFEISRTTAGITNSLLRRNIHRLEKGLIMRPRREVFGLDYITETVAKYEAIVAELPASRLVQDPEFRWFTDVLSRYFSVTRGYLGLDSYRQRFDRLKVQLGLAEEQSERIPFRQARRASSAISYEHFISLCRQRKSVRWFLQRAVPREELMKALEAARFAPSACNRYPFFFHVFDEKDKVDIVSTLPGGTVGFSQNFPVIIAIVGELRNYYGERDRHLIYVDASLAAMSVVLAAETLGLATCCINWPDIEEAEQVAERVLKLEPDQRPVMFMAMGYPDPEGLVCWSEKKPISDVCRINADLGHT